MGRGEISIPGKVSKGRAGDIPLSGAVADLSCDPRFDQRDHVRRQRDRDAEPTSDD